MKILKSQREQFNQVIDLVSAMTIAIHTNNREAYEAAVKKLKGVLR